MEKMKKLPRSILVATGIQVLFLTACMLCLQSCNWNKKHKTDIVPIEIPMGEPSSQGPFGPPEMRGVHKIFDSLMTAYWGTDSNRVIYNPGSILVEAMEIDSERHNTE